MPPGHTVTFDVIGSNLIDIRVSIVDQMERFLGNSGQSFDIQRLNYDIDGHTLDVSSYDRQRSMPSKYVAHCTYVLAR